MLHHTVTPLPNGLVTLNIELPENLINPILQAFSSMAEIAKSATYKLKSSPSPERLAEQRKRNDTYYLSLCEAVIGKFDEIYKKTSDVRQSISETNKQIKSIYPSTCYDTVKHILAKNNRLKNKSFNMEKKC